MSLRSARFRDSVRGERKQRGGTGWRGSYRDRLDIPKAEATPVLLMRAEYEDLRPKELEAAGGVPEVKHYHTRIVHSLKLGQAGPGSYREFTCSPEKCVPCHAKAGGDKRVATKSKFAMNCLHFALYLQEDDRDAKGNFRCYEEDTQDGKHKKGEPYRVWNEVLRAGDRKDVMDQLDEWLASGECMLARRKYLDVGSGHIENLMVIDEMASKRCFCGGKLAPTEFHCEKCDEVLCDVNNANLAAKDVVAYSGARQRCTSCGHHGFTKATSICDSCDAPSPMSAFDVVAYVRRAGEGAQSTIICEEIVPLSEFQLADGSYIITGWEQKDDEWAPTWADNVKELMVQYNFEQIMSPPTPEFAASVLKIDNPFGPPAGAQGARNYARNDSPPARRPPIRR
jgi:hypothetical protein